jgi:hypothetical protein
MNGDNGKKRVSEMNRKRNNEEIKVNEDERGKRENRRI